MIEIQINPNDFNDYKKFLQCKQLPNYQVIGNTIQTDEISYNLVFGGNLEGQLTASSKHLFDYQIDVVNMALERRRFAAFLDCGLGKTHIELEWANRVAEKFGKVLFLCPLSVLEDIQRISKKFYGYRMSNIRNEEWKTDVAILNWESMREIDNRDIKGVVLDESSILKNDAGKIRKWLTRLSSVIPFRLAASATPSPNDRSEYATHAVFLGLASSVNEFYARYFRKNGTRWILKSHAEDAFYRELKKWAVYIHSPSHLGYCATAEMKEEPDYIVLRSRGEGFLDDRLFVNTFSLQEANKVIGQFRADTSQDRFKNAISAIQNEKNCLIWVSRNIEHQAFKKELGDDVQVIEGATSIEKRVDIIDGFRNGHFKYLISKPKILGFGVNIPECQSMLFSGYDYSFERFYQAVRRGHRYGREGRLKVYIPVSHLEEPIWDLLRQKIKTFDEDVLKFQGQFLENE